ncbi:MAG: hypothetical protein M0R06_01260 [Sphaerochaeta sp.]|jgi:hypothetical protein|nr:hypothetical protein [Sphaerochaeta sp.]
MILSGQACAESFITKKADGSLLAATVGPVGVLYVNGVANGAVVTITGANPYKWAVTLPALNVGDLAQMYITATVDAIATGEFVWEDNVGIMPAVAGDAMALTGAERTSTATAVWASAARTLTSFGTLVADGAAAAWAYATRTLTQTVSSATAAMTGATLNMTYGVTYTTTLSGMTIPSDWSKIYLTIKKNKRDVETAAILQILETSGGAAADGAKYVDGVAATATQQAQASLTVSQAAGTIVVYVQDDLMDDFASDYHALDYDVKYVDTDGDSALLCENGIANIEYTPTRTI